MLVLSRKKSQSIVINDEIEITVIDMADGKVKLGIKAPKEMDIYRKELFDDIKVSNEIAAKSSKGNMKMLKDFFKRI